MLIGRGGALPVVVGFGAFGSLRTQTVEVRVEPELLAALARVTSGRSFEIAESAAFDAILPEVSGAMDEARPRLAQVTSRDQRTAEQVLGAVHRLEWDARLKHGEAAAKARDKVSQPSD